MIELGREGKGGGEEEVQVVGDPAGQGTCSLQELQQHLEMGTKCPQERPIMSPMSLGRSCCQTCAVPASGGKALPPESLKLYHLKDFISEGWGSKQQVGPMGQAEEAQRWCWAM